MFHNILSRGSKSCGKINWYLSTNEHLQTENYTQPSSINLETSCLQLSNLLRPISAPMFVFSSINHCYFGSKLSLLKSHGAWNKPCANKKTQRRLRKFAELYGYLRPRLPEFLFFHCPNGCNAAVLFWQ